MQTYEITFNERTKVGKTLLAFLEENKKQIKVKDPTKMTKEEYMQMLQESTEQAERGEVFELRREDIKKFLGLE